MTYKRNDITNIIFFTLYTTLWNDFVKLKPISRTASPQTVIYLVSLRCWQYDIINLLQAFYCGYIFAFGLNGDHENSFSALTITQLSSKCGGVEVGESKCTSTHFSPNTSRRSKVCDKGTNQH